VMATTVVEGGEAQSVHSRRVYVGNLDWGVEWQDLKDHMRQAGEVVYADVFRYDDGKSKVICHTDTEFRVGTLNLNDQKFFRVAESWNTKIPSKPRLLFPL
jgi:RNA recognition motif-containing protein